MSNFSKRAVRWAAPVALVGAVGLVACGDGDDETTRTAAPKAAVSGSENRPAWSGLSRPSEKARTNETAPRTLPTR